MLYFLGGENIAKRDAKEINMQAFEDAGGAPSVLVFAWARPSFDASYSRRKRFLAYLLSLGVSAVDFAEFNDSFERLKEKMEGSGLVYLTGGQVSTLLSRLRDRNVQTLLSSYRGIIVGRSAGAMVLGQSCLVTNRYSGNKKSVKGLGLVEFSVKAHYLPSQDRLLYELSRSGRVYAVAHGAALVCNGESSSFVGDVFLFENGKKTLLRGAVEFGNVFTL